MEKVNFYENDVNSIQKMIDLLNQKIQNNPTGEIMYTKLLEERELKALTNLQDYPLLKFYYGLLERSQDLYKAYRKSELLGEYARLSAEKSKLSLDYNRFKAHGDKLNGTSVSARKMAENAYHMQERINELDRQIAANSAKNEGFNDKSYDELKEDLFKEFDADQIKKISKLVTIQDLTNKEIAFYHMMQDKNKFDELKRILNQINAEDAAVKTETVSILLPMQRFPIIHNYLVNDYNMRNGHINVNSEQLGEILDQINSLQNTFLIDWNSALSLINPHYLDKLQNVDFENISLNKKIFEKYFTINKNNIYNDYLNVSADYQRLKAKIFRSKSENLELNKLRESLKQLTHKIVNLISDSIINLITKFFKITGVEYPFFPITLKSIANNNEMILDRYATSLDYFKDILESLHNGNTELNNKNAKHQIKKSHLINDLSVKGGVALADNDTYEYTMSSLNENYDKVFLAFKMKYFDSLTDEAVDNYVNDFKVHQAKANLTLLK